MNTMKRLYRSRTDRMISGVCGGLGNYIGIDPTVVRAVFAISAIFLHVLPVVLYIALMLIVPEEPLTAGSAVVDINQNQQPM